jgi:ABC-type hemin transport system ATPase subunit
MSPLRFGEFFGKGVEKTILNSFDGVVKSGEMLVVLGRPGSGCSTLLKTLMGEHAGLDVKKQSVIHYNGMFFESYSIGTLTKLNRYPTRRNDQAFQGRNRLQPGS